MCVWWIPKNTKIELLKIQAHSTLEEEKNWTMKYSIVQKFGL